MTRALFRTPQEHGYTAKCFTIRPCPSCGKSTGGSASTDDPSVVQRSCSRCGHRWLQREDPPKTAA